MQFTAQADAGAAFGQDDSEFNIFNTDRQVAALPDIHAIGNRPGSAMDKVEPCAKLAADGSSLVYSTYLGGSVIDSATAIAVDSSGNAPPVA